MQLCGYITASCVTVNAISTNVHASLSMCVCAHVCIHTCIHNFGSLCTKCTIIHLQLEKYACPTLSRHVLNPSKPITAITELI
ncbi:hypothetical protein HanRHA438_Chr04g0169721 [Helianthus annuus]|nr:hypothetical protein HanRHA438_Chr04g0169721 [Helianthus annuus]